MFSFQIQKKGPGLARVGKIITSYGVIETPAFVVVGTKATVKALSPEQVKSLGAQVVLANTYHLYLQPGDELVKKAGGLGKFMNWPGPTMTDSGGFQVFSLGVAFGNKVSKISSPPIKGSTLKMPQGRTLGSVMDSDAAEDFSVSASSAKIDDEGVIFRSHLDGSEHRFTPEKSMQIQHNLGANIIFAFDECTSPLAPREYQEEALARTHRWAKRSLAEHRRLSPRFDLKGIQGRTSVTPALFGIVQGGRFQDLREQSARFISQLDFAGFGIGGSFEKKDLDTAVGWVNQILPEEKPRHLLGIGEPEDLFAGVENGVDTFDCVTPTRLGRNGTLMTKQGRVNILNNQYREDFSTIEAGCQCYTCAPRHGGAGYTRAYLAHLFRAKEMLAGTLASIHNLYFSVNLVEKIRQSLLVAAFPEFKKVFLDNYSRKV
jgi:queuine tRNA-ribosyltransferase